MKDSIFESLEDLALSRQEDNFSVFLKPIAIFLPHIVCRISFTAYRVNFYIFKLLYLYKFYAK